MSTVAYAKTSDSFAEYATTERVSPPKRSCVRAMLGIRENTRMTVTPVKRYLLLPKFVCSAILNCDSRRGKTRLFICIIIFKEIYYEEV